MLADRYGPARVIAAGLVLLALGNAAVVLAPNGPSLLVVLAFGGAVGAAAGGAPLLLGAVSQRVSPARRGLATGIVGAGGSAGQLAIAPAAQGAIAMTGWMNAMLLGALLTLAAVPLARAFRARGGGVGAAPAATPAPAGSRAALRRLALRDPRYWLLTTGFLVCGFHVGFLTTHMPGVIELCGLPVSMAGTWIAIVGGCNIVGSLVAGLMIQKRSMPHMLMALYAARAAGVLCFMLVPKTPAVLLLFALWMGVTYMAALPPTAGLIARMYGPASLSTLLGLTMLFHQVGSFLGVWLGGVAVEAGGHYDWMWIADASLAMVAVAVHLPLRDRERTGPLAGAGAGAGAAA